MTPPSLRLVSAWVFGALLVSASAADAAAPARQPVQKPKAVAPVGVLAAPVAAATNAADAAAKPAPAMSVGEARNTLERGMTELGELAMRARQSGDSIRIACVQSKQDRAEAVMEVATGDLLTAQDPATDAQTRAFAGEKLAEGALQLKDLVAQARACTGREEANGDAASNDAKQPQQVLPQDPTGALPPANRGFPPIDPRPPVASPVL
jgi:hypothetical protein